MPKQATAKLDTEIGLRREPELPAERMVFTGDPAGQLPTLRRAPRHSAAGIPGAYPREQAVLIPPHEEGHVDQNIFAMARLRLYRPGPGPTTLLDPAQESAEDRK